MVVYLHALGFGPARIARAIGVTRQTVTADLHVIEEEWGDKLTAPQAAAQVRGLAHQLSGKLMDLMKHEDPVVKLQALRTLWAIFRERLVLEGLFGTVPKEVERVEVNLGRETMEAIFQALTVRMSADAQLELERALRSVGKEQPKLLQRLGFGP